jgi:hypothetical protein
MSTTETTILPTAQSNQSGRTISQTAVNETPSSIGHAGSPGPFPRIITTDVTKPTKFIHDSALNAGAAGDNRTCLPWLYQGRLSTFCRKNYVLRLADAPPESAKDRLKQFLERLFNNNEPEFFYLHQDASIELGGSLMHYLRLSIPLPVGPLRRFQGSQSCFVKPHTPRRARRAARGGCGPHERERKKRPAGAGLA